MMDPDSGVMRMLDDDEAKKMLADLSRHGDDAAAPMMYPKDVLWREGEEIEVRGCWFRVSAVRRTRVTLVPIPRPKGGE